MESKRVISTKKSIALIAHDHKKNDLIAWVKENKAALANHILFATGTTGKLIESEIKQPVNRMLSGPLGGDQEIGALIATGKIDLMIFFSDPMEMQPHDSDVRALVRLGTAWNIPMALNRASADFLVSSPYMAGDYEIEIPDYSSYLNRKIKD
ncbi:methylglyoxal synthase [Rhizosphaericola mali]|uniref:Methylglyoxal synthase n=1 Tax=Rhizosphaericola mali TaxID=2545455 RepID=A0A5P2G1W9_9BACT|nr:methylglyoxal synthase [Rhizosphaericola mali]QES87840.1 methylglyoxal synthase [Rhizosphaericola mali]